MKKTFWQFATAANIRFGRGSSSVLGDELRRLQVTRPLVIADKTLSQLPKITDIFDQIRNVCPKVIHFNDCRAEPAIAVAEAAIEMGRIGQADMVIGIGGGSNMDVAKIAATVLRHGESPRTYFGFDAIPGPILPLIAVPTTAGTGSEVSHSAVLSDEVAGVKVSTLSRYLRPSVAIVDPGLTDSCPPIVTAHSGIDALVHAIEAYTNRDFRDMVDVDPQARAYEGSYPLTRLIAAEAIRLVARYLVKAVSHPEDVEARDGMAMAAMLAGMAFSNSGVALVHALEYPIGILTHCSHGEGNGLLLPHVMRFNLPQCQQAFAEMAPWLQPNAMDRNSADGQPALNDAETRLEEDAMHAIDAVVELQKAIGIRRQLRQLGLERTLIPEAARRTFQIKRLMDINPRSPSESDLIAILEAAY